jgi:hypothetical protein
MDPLKKPEGISWDAATVELPEMPMLPPGEDAMSATISAVLPTLAAPLMANVTALQAEEGMFSGKLVAAQSAYQNADDSGGQAVGQVTSMLGQLGQMGGQAASSAGQAGGGGQGGGVFGSIIQQAMQAAQQLGGQGGGPQGAGGAPPPAGQPAPGAPRPSPPPAAPQVREGEAEPTDEQKREDEQRAPLLHAEGAGPGQDQPNAGAALVPPHTPATDADIEDLARRML